MYLRKYSVAIAAGLFLQGIAFAQQPVPSKNLGNEDVTVVKDYQPVLNDAFKINILPETDTISLNPPEFSYDINPSPLNSNYNITPIKPVRIKDDNIKKLYRGFVKLGYGLENTPLAEVSYNSLRSKNFDAGFRFRHLSSSGKIKDYGFPGNSDNHASVFGTRYFEKFQLKGKVNYDRTGVHYYGYKTPPELFSKSETRHSMSTISGDAGVSNLNNGKDEWKYNGGIGFYSFSDNRSLDESNFNIRAGFGKNINEGTLLVDASGDFWKVDQGSQSYNRNIIRLRPRIEFIEKQFSVIAGANLAIEGNDGDGDYHLYPQIRGSYQVISDAFTVYAEISGDLDKNELRGFAEENPFIKGPLAILNTNRKLSITAGTDIKLAHDLMFRGSAMYARLVDQPFYFNVFDSLYPVSYSVGYDKADLLRVNGSLEYKLNQKIILAFNATLNQYDPEQLKEPLYVVPFRFGTHAEYVIADKIFVKGDLFYNGKAHSLEYPANDGVPVFRELKSYFDANLGIDYRYSKVLSAFVQLNNLGFSQYFKYYRYPSYRFTGMIGATYSF